MAASPPNFPRIRRVMTGVLVSLALLAPAFAQQSREQPISLNTDSYEVDFRTGKTLMRNVSVSQGDVSIIAERAEATGLDFEDSRWVFSGDVRINAEQRGNLRSDRAIVEFRDNRIAKATIIGNPAQFEQKRADVDQMARGRAGEMVYDVNAGTVRLARDAWLSNGPNEISGPLLVYDIRLERVQAVTKPGSKERVRITIVPKPAADEP